jgi:hypothetical protein
LLEKLAQNKLTAKNIEKLLLRIEAIDYEDIVEWSEAQRAVDTSL